MYRKFTLALLAASIVACGGGGGGGGDNIAPQPNNDNNPVRSIDKIGSINSSGDYEIEIFDGYEDAKIALEGVWESDCLLVEDTALFKKIHYQYSQSRYQILVQEWNDSACDVSIVGGPEIVDDGTYLFTEDTGTGIYKIEYTDLNNVSKVSSVEILNDTSLYVEGANPGELDYDNPYTRTAERPFFDRYINELDDEEERRAQFISEFKGTWRSECFSEYEDSHFYTFDYNIDPQSSIITVTVAGWSDAQCKEESEAQFTMTGGFTVEEEKDHNTFDVVFQFDDADDEKVPVLIVKNAIMFIDTFYGGYSEPFRKISDDPNYRDYNQM